MLNSQCTIMVTHKLCIVLYELCIPKKVFNKMMQFIDFQ